MELYNAQKTMLEGMRIHPSYALHAEPGTGKTIPTLIQAIEKIKAGEADSILYVGPKAALGAVDRDLAKLTPEDAEIFRSHAAVVSYDLVWRRKEYDRQFDIIILDEAHYIKNKDSRRGKFLLKIGCRAKFRYELTGTPISNGALEDIWSQIAFLDPYEKWKGYIYSRIFKEEWEARDPGMEYRGSFYEFLQRYCILNQWHSPESYINVDELQEIIRKYSFRITKAECLDLPSQTDEIVEVGNKEPSLYRKLAMQSALPEFDKIVDNPLSKMMALRQLCSGYVATDEGLVERKCEKIEALKELIESYPDMSKLVIFAEFKHSIRTIEEMLEGMNICYVTLDGDQKDKDIWRKFQSDPKIRVIVCQYQSGGTGIDLFAASTEIFYEPTLRSTILEQARDRIHRAGQTEPCTYIHLLTKGTIEEDIYDALKNYEDFSTKFFEEYMKTFTRSKGAEKGEKDSDLIKTMLQAVRS